MSEKKTPAIDLIITLLPTLPIFHGLSPALLNLIVPEMVRSYRDKDVVFAQGDEADGLIVLLHGQVCISANGTFLVSRQPYEIIGEQALIEGTPRSATGTAQGAVQVLVLPYHLIDKFMTEAAFLKNLLLLVSKKLSQATNERAYRYRTEELLFSEFRAHVSDTVLNKLLATGLDYGEPRFIDAIILFSDIRSFTDRSAQMEPAQIAKELTPYLDAVVDIIHKHEGLVDKFIGDAVLAVWGYSTTDREITTLALSCAREMVAIAKQMHFGDAPIQIGVGLNAGQVFIGNVGGDGKRQFTVLGTPVNLAARYEAASKELGVPIVIGTALYERLAPEVQAKMHPHHDQPVKGASPQSLYTFVGEGD